MTTCPICKKYPIYPETHICPPVFVVSLDDVGEQWTVYALNAENAAIEFAAVYDEQNCYDIAQAEGGHVTVIDSDEKTWKIFVAVDPRPVYYAESARGID